MDSSKQKSLFLNNKIDFILSKLSHHPESLFYAYSNFETSSIMYYLLLIFLYLIQ